MFARNALKDSQLQIEKQQEVIVVALNKSKLSAASQNVINKLNAVLGLMGNDDYAEIVDAVVHFDLDRIEPSAELA